MYSKNIFDSLCKYSLLLKAGFKKTKMSKFAQIITYNLFQAQPLLQMQICNMKKSLLYTCVKILTSYVVWKSMHAALL